MFHHFQIDQFYFDIWLIFDFNIIMVEKWLGWDFVLQKKQNIPCSNNHMTALSQWFYEIVFYKSAKRSDNWKNEVNIASDSDSP
jgi:hypothetical protein